MKYDLTLIPIIEGRAIFKGRDYTTSAKKYNINLNGTLYYMRRNHEGNVDKISEFLEQTLPNSSMTVLDQIEFALKDKPAPIRILIESLEQEAEKGATK